MFKIKLLLSILSIHTLFTTHLFATAIKNEIIWFQHQRPPWMINSGEYKNQGYGDKIRQSIIKKLPNYTHRTLAITPSRFYKEINKYTNVCYGPVMKLQNTEKFFHWSQPVYTIPEQTIIVLKETYEKLGSPKTISMKKLIKNQDLIFGNIANMKHYPFDLTPYRQQENVLTLENSGATESLIAMLQKKRIDWMYDFPFFIVWHNKLAQKRLENYRTIKTTEEALVPKILAHMVCTKNAWGKNVIKQINTILTKEHILKVRDYVRPWQLDEINKKEFDRLNKELFGF